MLILLMLAMLAVLLMLAILLIPVLLALLLMLVLHEPLAPSYQAGGSPVPTETALSARRPAQSYHCAQSCENRLARLHFPANDRPAGRRGPQKNSRIIRPAIIFASGC
jgi:hypothetical protein